MTNLKIVAIAPYQGLKELIQSTANEDSDIDVTVEIGDLHEGVQLAKLAEENGADIIISRGGTAELIRNEVKIPVIEIEVSAYDLIRVFTLVKDNPEKKAIVGFKNVIENAMTICTLLDMDISAFTVSKERDVVPKLIQLQKENYHIIVGDAITVRNAEALGMNGFLLTSGRESVLKAFDEAKKIKNLYSPFMKEALILQVIVEQSKVGIVVFNEKGSIIFINQAARHLENIFTSSILEQWGYQILSDGEIKTVVEVNGQIWSIVGSQLNYSNQIYPYIKLEPANDSTERKIQGVRVNLPEHDVTISSMNLYSSKNSSMKKTIEKAKMVCSHDEFVWITGENGTGKEQLAYLIHLGSKGAAFPFLTVDCELVPEDNWNDLLGNQNKEGIFASNENGTIYLKKIEELSLDNQKKLLDYLTIGNTSFRLIVSSTPEIEKRVARGLFAHELYYQLGQIRLVLPPLRDRVEDIEGLTQLFINKYNYDYGKQLAGMRSDALEELKNHKWPGNVDELKQVIKEAVLLARDPFIEKGEIRNLLLQNQYTDSSDNSISLTGTLKEIELDIIKKVLKEEDMNYSNTAKRLGINRSTLWRKLKEE